MLRVNLVLILAQALTLIPGNLTQGLSVHMGTSLAYTGHFRFYVKPNYLSVDIFLLILLFTDIPVLLQF